MERIRVLMVAGYDVGEARVRPYITTVLAHWESAWFAYAGAGAAACLPLEPPPLVLDAGWAWFSRRRELATLALAARGADVLDLHGYQALLWAARAGLLTRPTVYTRHTVPASGGGRRREVWLMAQASAVVVPAPAALPTRRRDAHVVPILESGDNAEPPSDPRPDPRPGGRVRVAVLADNTAARPVLDALVAAVDNVEWLPLRGRLGGRAPVDSSWQAMTEADVVLLPAAEVGEGALLDAALASARPVVAARVVGFVGRFTCPVEGLLVDPADPAAWVETVQALLADADLRSTLAAAARRAHARGDVSQAVRILQSVYAGVLLERTGRCPVCPDSPAVVPGSR